MRLEIRGDLPEAELAAEYAAADVFALLSLHEPWGVVVNEAAASGLPLILSDRVGAARDLLRDGENGFLVPSGDATAAAAALGGSSKMRAFATPPERARGSSCATGATSSSVENFLAAVSEATPTVDLLLNVSHVIPGRSARCLDAAARQTIAKGFVREHAANRFDDCRSVVWHDQGLAVCEEFGDAAPFGQDHRRPRSRGFRRDHPKALAFGREDEDVCLRVEIVRRNVSCRQGVDPARCGLGGLRLLEEGRGAMSIVGTSDDEMNRRDLLGRSKEVVDPFPGCEPADVKDDRRLRRNAELGSQAAVCDGSLLRMGTRCRARAPSPAVSPDAITSSRSRSEATTTAAAPRATPR